MPRTILVSELGDGENAGLLCMEAATTRFDWVAESRLRD